jgi:phosphohistidine phosphatase
MQLLVIRHAIAAPRSPDLEDAARPLTSRGAKRFRRAVAGLAALGQSIDRVYHSPWLRAVETAELLRPIAGDLHETALLADSPGGELLELLTGEGDATVAVVGHEPWMGELCALLVTGSTEHGEHFRFKKGGIAWLEGDPRTAAMTLSALIPPAVLRALQG